MREVAILGLVLATGFGPIGVAAAQQASSARPDVDAPRPLGRSTIEAVDVELDVEFTDEQLVYYRMQTTLDRDFEAMRMFRPGYSFWQHVFTIPDGSVAFGSAEDGRLLAVFPTRGDWVRSGRFLEPSVAPRLAGARIEGRLNRRRDQVELLAGAGRG